MRRLFTISALASAALFASNAFAAPENDAQAWTGDENNLHVRLALSETSPHQQIIIRMFITTQAGQHALTQYQASAGQTDTHLNVALEVPIEEYFGADDVYIDVADERGFSLYEVQVDLEDLEVIVSDLDGPGADGPNMDPGTKVKSGDRHNNNGGIGNPYGDDILFPSQRPVTANDDANDFGDGSPIGNSTIPVDDFDQQNDPADDLGDGSSDLGDPPNDGPSLGNPAEATVDETQDGGDLASANDGDPDDSFDDGGLHPYGDDTVDPNENHPFVNANSADDFSDGSSNDADPFAPGDGDLGAGDPSDTTLVSAPAQHTVFVTQGSVNDLGDGSTGINEAIANDCNGNGQSDLLEIANDPALDFNNNSLIDRCELNGDLDGNGVIDVSDLITMIMNWGSCLSETGCLGDLNSDGNIDEQDVSQLMTNWDS